VVGECHRLAVAVLPPDVNCSRMEFRVESDGIRYGLGAVKNVGAGAVEQLVNERDANGPYTSLEEFCRRQDLHTVNKRVIESLIKCGAFDQLGQREMLLEQNGKRLDAAIAAAQIDQRAASTGQTSLFDVFGGAPETSVPPVLPVVVAAGAVNARERAVWEKEVLGFQFGDHPFMEAAAWLAGRLTHDTSQITAEVSGERVVLAGLVTGARRLVTRNKAQMAVLMIEDLHGTIEVVVFPRIYERTPDLWREDAILVLEGKVDTRSDRPQLVLDRAEEWIAPENGAAPPPPPPLPAPVAPIEDAAPAPAQAQAPPPATSNGHAKRILHVDVPRGEDDNACVRVLEQLQVLVERYPGSDEIHLVLRDRGGERIELAGARILVQHTPDLESHVRSLVGADHLSVV
jgi:DNA polymerase-3 subunit alpha